VRLFRKNDDLRQLVEHQRRRRAFGTVVASAHSKPPPVGAEPDLAPVVSIAAARARRAGHPSIAGQSGAPLTARH
jgi:hypothetical protein